MTTKTCSRCKQDKTIEEFSKSSKEADGRKYECKSCQNEYNKKYREYFKQYWSEHKRRPKNIQGISFNIYRRNGGQVVVSAFIRAKYKCEICGSRKNLSIHHKDRNGRNKLNQGLEANNSLENLQVLCKKCHGSIHGKQSNQ